MVAVAVVRTYRMGRVRRSSGGSVRGNHSPVVVVAVGAAAVVAAAVGLGLLWDRAVLLLVHPPFRRLLRTWRVEEGRHRAGARRGVFLRLLPLAHVAHNVTDAVVGLIEGERVEWGNVAEEREKVPGGPIDPKPER